jgi:hypothetical protein
MIKKILLFFLILFIIIGVAGYFFIYQPVMKIKAKGMVFVASAKEMKEVFSKNDIDLMSQKLDDVTKKYADFKKEAQTMYWATFIPYVKDAKNGIEAGDYLLKAAKESIEAVAPYADLIGFKKGKGSFVEKSSEDRLQTAILTLDKMLSKIDIISDDIKKAEGKINAIDLSRYPEKIGKTEVRAKLVNIKEQFIGMASLFVDAKPLLKKLPEIFGKDKEKKYLILFQNDKELRATGGFLTSYAVFKIKNGKMTVERSEDIYSLDNSIAVHPPAPREILTYHKGVTKFYIRDSNLSPDVPTFIKTTFTDLYKKSGGLQNYDGVIMIDSKVLVDMLTIFGDTQADGVTFSASIDKRCNCPQVLYKLFDMVDRPTPYIRENRKGILGDLMFELFYKAIGFSPSKYWGTLVQQMFKNLQEKHILVYFVDPDIQSSIVSLNFGGTIRKYDGDYLHISNVNFAGAKSNLFVNESITSKTKTNNGGKISREVKVEYRNPYPASDCNLERGGLCLNATLRNWVRFYVPKGSQLVEFKGSIKKVQTYDELEKTVFEGYLEVIPEGKAEVTVTYTLPSNIDGKDYRLLIQKQPGTDNQKIQIYVDDKSVFKGVLDLDKEIRVK